MSLGVLTETRINGSMWALRRRLEMAFGRLRVGARPIVQTSVAATVAWFIAATVLGHEQPFFAAIVSLGVAVGEEGGRAGLRGRVRARRGGPHRARNRDGTAPDRGRRGPGDGCGDTP
ncbi:MAG: aromatic acid exporter family protein, partial [Rubrobacteraceae bacterium]|nr:aromatic acid exporter family protein [Rubrobacteraceae bacterium]